MSLSITEGADFSPGVKKPKAITKGEKERRLISSRQSREEDSSLPFRLWRLGGGIVSVHHRRCRLLTFGEETDGEKSDRGEQKVVK